MGAVIEDYLELMDEVLETAKSVPLMPGKYVVDVAKLRQCIDDIRANLPQEIKQATTIVMDRSSIIEDAKKQANDIVARAEERAKSLVANSEITKTAEQRAAEIEKQAVAKSKAIKSKTDDYVTTLLTQTEEALNANLSQVRKLRAAVKGSK
ncbi:MAG: ATPase [Huintestinicola sp.]